MLNIITAGFLLFSQVPSTGASSGGVSTGAPGGGPGVAQSVLERPVISSEYILMPGDECLSTIMGGTNYTYAFTISYEGKAIIQVPVGMSFSPILGETKKVETIDAVPLSGLTIKDAQDSLGKVFRKYFKNVSVKLTLVGMRMFNVFISGEVRQPGVVYASPVDRISEILKRSGGLTATGSKSTIRVLRADRTEILVDLERFESTGDLSVNPYVQDGDLVIVPPIKGMVTVKGAVFGRGAYELRVSTMTTERERTSEGLYELREGDRISHLVTRAGGVTPWADLGVAYVERMKEGGVAREKLEIDLYSILVNKDSEKDLALANGDILVIPPKSSNVYVLGEVEHPGPFPYEPNLRMTDYIAMAGVKTEAYRRGAKLKRGNKKYGYGKNPVVEPGDEIMVPRVLLKFWQDYVYITSVAATLLISYLTLSK